MSKHNEQSDIESVLGWANSQAAARFVDSKLTSENTQVTPTNLRRRVQRARIRHAVGQGTVAVIAVGAIGWGAVTLGSGLENPAPATTASQTEQSPSASPSPSADTETVVASPATGPLDTASLLAAATERQKSENPRGDSQSALRCDFDADENPRIQPEPEVPGDTLMLTDCAAVWVGNGQMLAPIEVTVRPNDTAESVIVEWRLTNSAAEPLTLDRASVVINLETPDYLGQSEDAGFPSPNGPSADGMSLAGPTLWNTENERVAVVNRESELVTLAPGESIEGTTEIRPSGPVLRGDVVARMLEDLDPALFTATVRVAPFASDDTDLLLVSGPQIATLTVG